MNPRARTTDGLLAGAMHVAILAARGVYSFRSEDVDEDGTVGVADFLAVLMNWG